MNVSAEPGAYLAKLGKPSSHPSVQCHLDYSSNFQKNDSSFDFDWLLHLVQARNSSCRARAYRSQQLTSSFLNTAQGAASERKTSLRAASLAMMALASVGLFGSGIALGTDERGLRGISGSCHECAKQNAANIEKIAEFTEFLSEDAFKLRSDVNDNFFMVTTELDALIAVQKEKLEIQKRNWKVIQEQFEIFGQNIHMLRDCDQLLFSRQQVIFSYDTIFHCWQLLLLTLKVLEAVFTLIGLT